MATKIDILRLISPVKENPILWDPTRDDYKLAELKPTIWNDIAQKLNTDRG